VSPPPGFDDIDDDYAPEEEDGMEVGGLREGEEGPRALPGSFPVDAAMEMEHGAGFGEQAEEKTAEEEEGGEGSGGGEEEEDEDDCLNEEDGHGGGGERGSLRKAMEELEADLSGANVSAHQA